MMLHPILLAAMAVAPPMARLQPVPFTEVSIKDAFWTPRRETNRKVSIPHAIKMCYETPRMENLIRAGNGEKGGFKGLIFDDSDVYKVIESAAYALAETRDPALEAKVDEMIAVIAKAQMPDGYLNSWYQLMAPDRRFTNLADNHELYCAGHLIEAAVAHHQATGKRTLLDVAVKFSDLLVKTFGDEPGKRMGYPGHPGPELALFKLWRHTGNEDYYKLSQFFIEKRGSRFFAQEKRVPLDRFNGDYWLDDVPIRDHRTIKGHAVRAAYLLAGVTDYANHTGDASLMSMLDRLWKNTVYRRVFVTGGLGPSGSNEGFTVDYDLPTQSAYQETCASIAMVLWGHRMGLLHGQTLYWDAVETALYNGFLSGVSLKGDTFFYTNPLASRGTHHRVPWFACSCCPPNVTRTLASLGQYAFAKSEDALYVNLYIGSTVDTKVGDERVRVGVATDYPWRESVTMSIDATSKPIGLRLRIPGWCENPKLQLNGKDVPLNRIDGYAVLSRKWERGDRVKLELPMPVKRVVGHPKARDIADRAAVQRGPIVYCLEGVDNPMPLESLHLPLGSNLSPRFERGLLGGVTVLEGTAMLEQEPEWDGPLYQSISTPKPVTVRAVPYYAWDNRKPGEMAVWLRYAPKPTVFGGLERSATVTASFLPGIAALDAIRDAKPIEASNRHPGQLFHFWPHKGSEEWVQYAWKAPKRIKGVKVYWFDDTGFGECRPPASWEVQVLRNGAWQPVKASAEYALTLDKWIEVGFEPVETSAIRLAMKLQPNWSAGIHEWQIVEDDE